MGADIVGADFESGAVCGDDVVEEFDVVGVIELFRNRDDSRHRSRYLYSNSSRLASVQEQVFSSSISNKASSSILMLSNSLSSVPVYQDVSVGFVGVAAFLIAQLPECGLGSLSCRATFGTLDASNPGEVNRREWLVGGRAGGRVISCLPYWDCRTGV